MLEEWNIQLVDRTEHRSCLHRLLELVPGAGCWRPSLKLIIKDIRLDNRTLTDYRQRFVAQYT